MERKVVRGPCTTKGGGGLQGLVEAVERLRETEVRGRVEARMREFREVGAGSSSEIFKELCFCLLTANFSAERCIEIQRAMGDGFLTLPEALLIERLRELGHRFPRARAGYIVEARRLRSSLKEVLESFGNSRELRDWLVREVRGVGYKEASHFLRNVGRTDVAIIDRHILNLLAEYGLIERPRVLTRRRYLEIEGLLRGVAEMAGLSLGELDLYLWYLETGKVLK